MENTWTDHAIFVDFRRVLVPIRDVCGSHAPNTRGSGAKAGRMRPWRFFTSIDQKSATNSREKSAVDHFSAAIPPQNYATMDERPMEAQVGGTSKEAVSKNMKKCDPNSFSYADFLQQIADEDAANTEGKGGGRSRDALATVADSRFDDKENVKKYTFVALNGKGNLGMLFQSVARYLSARGGPLVCDPTDAMIATVGHRRYQRRYPTARKTPTLTSCLSIVPCCCYCCPLRLILCAQGGSG